MKWFSSDWHLSHKKMIENSQRNFSSIEEMNDTIMSKMFKNMKRGDDFYFLGDMCWEIDEVENVLRAAKRKKIRFHWIAGNHDKKALKKYHGRVKEFDKQNTINENLFIKLTDRQGNRYPTFLSHYPMLTWDRSHYDAFLLFGHHHTHTHKADEIRKYELSGKILNVNCEFFNYNPINELGVINIMKTRPHNWDYIEKKLDKKL